MTTSNIGSTLSLVGGQPQPQPHSRKGELKINSSNPLFKYNASKFLAHRLRPDELK